MKFLITAGGSFAQIDRVRGIVNAHSHKTGTTLARTAWVRGHHVTVLTSEPEALTDLPESSNDSDHRVNVIPYRTFDDLVALLQQAVKSGTYDAIFHAASVSDYLCAGTYAPSQGTSFQARTKKWECYDGQPAMDECSSHKINSKDPEVWVRLVRAPKLIERFRTQWGYRGFLVKFKQESNVRENDLVQLAEKSRLRSDADLIVANTLESANHWAFVGPVDNRYDRIPRRELADHLILTLEHMARSNRAGPMLSNIPPLSNPDVNISSNSSVDLHLPSEGSLADINLARSKSELKMPLSKYDMTIPQSKAEFKIPPSTSKHDMKLKESPLASPSSSTSPSSSSRTTTSTTPSNDALESDMQQ